MKGKSLRCDGIAGSCLGSSYRLLYGPVYRAVCCAALLLLPAALPGGAAAQRENPEIARATTALEEVRHKIAVEEKRLAELHQKEQDIQRDLERIAAATAEAKRQQQELSRSLVEIDARRKELDVAIEDAAVQTAQLRGVFNDRLVATYKTHRRTSSLDYLLRATSSTDLLKRAYYLRRVAEFDRGTLDGLAEILDKSEADKRKLAGLEAQKKDGIIKAAELERQLEQQQAKQAALLREERERAKAKANALKKLRASARRLEKALQGLMGGEVDPTVPPLVEPTAVPTAAVDQPPVVIFDGRGLAAAKGRLEFPVKGKVLQRFGKQPHEEFADLLFIKGLEVSAAPGGEVRAVANGKVIFNKSLPGYGNVVILDHGKRYYTLYGRLAEATRKLGELVAAGSVIAKLGESDNRGRNFYFELRIAGKATDPAPYFKNLPRG